MSQQEKDISSSPIDGQEEFAKAVAAFHLPRFDELPTVDLYMDQILNYVTDQVALTVPPGEKALTASMVNNYVKRKLIPQPQAKKYSHIHMAHLIVVCILKQTFSITEIFQLIGVQADNYELSGAYDMFCTAFEESLRVLVTGRTASDRLADDCLLRAPDGATFSLEVNDVQGMTPQRRLLLSTVTSVANRIYVERTLESLATEGTV